MAPPKTHAKTMREMVNALMSLAWFARSSPIRAKASEPSDLETGSRESSSHPRSFGGIHRLAGRKPFAPLALLHAAGPRAIVVLGVPNGGETLPRGGRIHPRNADQQIWSARESRVPGIADDLAGLHDLTDLHGGSLVFEMHVFRQRPVRVLDHHDIRLVAK